MPALASFALSDLRESEVSCVVLNSQQWMAVASPGIKLAVLAGLMLRQLQHSASIALYFYVNVSSKVYALGMGILIVFGIPTSKYLSKCVIIVFPMRKKK